MIRDYVKENEQEFQPQTICYINSVERMREINLARISEDNVKGIIKPYLYKWGKMGRTLGSKKSWEREIAKKSAQIRKHSGNLGRKNCRAPVSGNSNPILKSAMIHSKRL